MKRGDYPKAISLFEEYSKFDMDSNKEAITMSFIVMHNDDK